MAINHLEIGEHLRPMSELGGYTVEKGDPDPRGWTVVNSSGASLGRVTDLLVDTAAMKVRGLVIDSGAGAGATGTGTTLFDIDDVHLQGDTRQVLAHGRGVAAESGRSDYAKRDTATSGSDARLTRSEEELRIGKREVSKGEVRIAKHVETEHVSQPVTRRREEVVIERRPVTGEARASAIDDAEVRIPLMEEEVVVEKRPVVKEELVVGKRIVEEQQVVEADVRREEFDIDDRARQTTRNDPSRRDGH